MNKKIENFQKHSEISKKNNNNNRPRAINWENLYMYFEDKIIAFIIAEGRGETERKTRRDQEKNGP